jgi:hypothetical protein
LVDKKSIRRLMKYCLLKKAILPEWAKLIAMDLQECHKMQKLEFGKETEISF